MRSLNKLAIQGIVVILAATIVISSWIMIYNIEFQRLPDDYSLNIEYDAQTTMVDDVYGELLGPYFQRDVLSEKVIEKNGNILTIQSSVTGKRIDTNEIMFQMEKTYKVDATTQMHIDKEGKRFGFLPGVEKKDYDFFHPSVFYDDPMVFKRTDVVNGLEVYVFEVVTKDADTSRAFSQFSPHVIHTDTTSRLWIEPITGNLIRFDKDWNNYLVENGENVNTIQIGGKKTSEFTELILAQYTKEKISNIQFNKILMPTFLLVLILGLGSIWILTTYLGEMKKESVEKDQMAIIGKITSKISHDLRNPLSIVKISLETIENDDVSPEIKKKSLERVQRGIIKIENQIESILDFVRNTPLKVGQVQLNTIIEASIMNSQIPETIKIEKNIPEILILVDINQIETVFTNIITNAIQAVGRGTIKISARIKTKTIEIEFEDTGPRIPKETMKDIFEPLFTTKKKGTGLGLASCKTIVERHDGTISVKNDPTRFTIILPKQ